jgi:hypothetical protein
VSRTLLWFLFAAALLIGVHFMSPGDELISKSIRIPAK